MNISITPELEDLIAKKVKTGMYHSASEVIREGLRLLKERDELKELQHKELKKEIQKGYNSAVHENAPPWDVEKFKNKVRTHQANGKKGKA